MFRNSPEHLDANCNPIWIMITIQIIKSEDWG